MWWWPKLRKKRCGWPREKTGNPNLTVADLRQDADVLDTWFSSGLWPISVFDGIRHPDNPEINYYYPTNDLVTAPEIIFFWVARMIIFGYEYRSNRPFRNVYFTGIVRDRQRRKMSKSLGNSPDPLELIKQYGPMAFAPVCCLVLRRATTCCLMSNCASRGAISPTKSGTRCAW